MTDLDYDADPKRVNAAMRDAVQAVGYRAGAAERDIMQPRFYAFRGDRLVAAWDGPSLAGFAAYRAQRRAHAGWGRYVVLDAIWTAPEARGSGVGSRLLAAVKDHGVSDGADRFGSITGTPAGVALQARAGHDFWAPRGGGTPLLTDTPLDPGGRRGPGPYCLSRIPSPIGVTP